MMARWQGNDTFVPRNIFVGLKDENCALKVGKIDTPVKQLSAVVDTFNNYIDNKADVAGILLVKTVLITL